MTDGISRQGDVARSIRGDVVGGLVLLVLGGIAAYESVQYGLGRWSAPGPGFLPFGASVLIIALALVIVPRELRGAVQPETGQVTSKTTLRDVLAVLSSMIAYAALLSVIGFLATTALFIGFLLRFVGGKSWRVTLFVAAAVAIAAHILFVVLLAVQMPVTPLGF
ncbi:MAG TPA: tripartite tricarboxylate transporter TctB family protein [Pseudolabrys sp.]|jgi:putative tricarboxylic transport membrane protein